MSQGAKRSGDELTETPQKKPNIKPQHSDVENESSESAEEETVMLATGVDDVFESNQADAPEQVKEGLQDWNSPVILIVAKHTRDKLLAFLQQISNNQNLPATTVETSSTSVLAAASLKDVEPTTANISEATIEENMTKLRLHKNQVIRKLDDFQRSFSERELTKNLSTHEEFESFKRIRKSLSQFMAANNNLQKSFDKVIGEKENYICNLEPNIIPNRMNTEFLANQIDCIHMHNKQVNLNMLNHMILQTTLKTIETETLITRDVSLILAKAWRAVNKSLNRHQYNDNDRPNRNQHNNIPEWKRRKEQETGLRETDRNVRREKYFQRKSESEYQQKNNRHYEDSDYDRQRRDNYYRRRDSRSDYYKDNDYYRRRHYDPQHNRDYKRDRRDYREFPSLHESYRHTADEERKPNKYRTEYYNTSHRHDNYLN